MTRSLLLQPYFRPLINAKRFWVAARDALSPVRESYAQHGEDRYIRQQLSGVDLTSGIYVDIGANQPTQISNTYLFYRAGGSGVAIEPNPSLENLYKRFRPRDVFLRIGCSDTSGVLPFKHTVSSVLSGFSDSIQDVVSTEYLPLLPLDQVLENYDYKFIYLLSIDVEGYDLQVLKGAEKTLSNTIFVVIEDTLGQEAILEIMQAHGFVEETRIAPNIIFVNPALYQILTR
jgi:FkbM family methyltransferase